jgi:hypothetical protein
MNLFLQNQWATHYFPNMDTQQTSYIFEKKRLVKSFFEWIFSGKLGEQLDIFFMKLAMKRWKRKFGTLYNEQDFSIAFKSKRNVSKNHPRFFQKQVLNLLKERVEQFEISNKIKLSA